MSSQGLRPLDAHAVEHAAGGGVGEFEVDALGVVGEGLAGKDFFQGGEVGGSGVFAEGGREFDGEAEVVS